MGLMLVVKNACFHYDAGKNSGFEEVNFSLKTGQVMCVLGPNGCGKTTMLKCLLGLLRLQGGSIRLDGQELSQMSRSAVARIVGYIPQLHQPAFPFSVLDTVLVGRAPHLGFLQSPGEKDIEIARSALEALSITHLSNKPFTQLSGGEKQMVTFARVLTQRPALLLMDEPTSHLDFGNQTMVLNVVQQLAATGMPIIMTSHFPDHAFLTSSKVAIMKKGRFLDFGPPEKVITEDNMEKIYGVKVRVMDVNDVVGYRVCLPLKNHLNDSNTQKINLEGFYAKKS
ncbi:MAG: ABC transporter ATP-binding protein [Dehalococcoidales bacterium]|nr:ABC transporter ATP-binding protein [Dehalococcoidales bacterium]